jgi:hypothetical protein
MILLMVVVSVNASEKKLRVKLEREYDLQLAQKQREIESRKLLQSVAKKHKSNIRDDQEKNIDDKFIEQRQKKNQRIQKKFYQSPLFQHYSPALDVLITTCVMPVVGVIYYSLIVDMPMGCYNSSNVCACFYL